MTVEQREQRCVLRRATPTQLVDPMVRNFEQALIALVKNAVEASPRGATVTLHVEPGETRVGFVITDQGHGMSVETLRHVGEPFFTTKETGKGMGLGTFLVRTLAERLGGTLLYRSEPGAGTTATFGIELNPTSTG